MSPSRTFTLHEAQTLLPVLEPLLRAAMQAHKRSQEIEAEMQHLVARILVAGGMQVDPIRGSRLRNERESAQQKGREAVAEILATGAQLKDLELGLLDFPCRLGTKTVLLCWKLGETGITHYHGSREGFAKRKPLDSRFYDHGRGGHIQ